MESSTSRKARSPQTPEVFARLEYAHDEDRTVDNARDDHQSRNRNQRRAVDDDAIETSGQIFQKAAKAIGLKHVGGVWRKRPCRDGPQFIDNGRFRDVFDRSFSNEDVRQTRIPRSINSVGVYRADH